MRRTIAEILRHLLLKRELDEESKDMAAAVVLALREIEETVDVAAAAWEKRNYYLKADRFRLEWEWVGPEARRLEELIRQGRWQRLPIELGRLVPRFADIRINKMTRKPSTWQASHRLLLEKG